MPTNATAIALPAAWPPSADIENLIEDVSVAAVGAIARSIEEYQDGGLTADTKAHSGSVIGWLAELWLAYPEVDVGTVVRQRLGCRGAPEFLIDALVEIVGKVRADEIAYERSQAH